MFMLYGHTVSALLAPQYQTGTWFALWQFQRGLTSSLFLLLSGFAFSIATTRTWPSHVRWSPAVARRIRRFLLFIVLGYALHFPVRRIWDLGTVSEERWRSFVSVDVLQLIGTTFIAVQLLVLVTRLPRVFTIVAFTLAAGAVLATPFIWIADWPRMLPTWLAAYVTPDAGSLFPLFPWTAFVLLGAGLGQLYGRWGAANLTRYANLCLLLPGATLVAVSLWARATSGVFGTGPGRIVPGEVLLRAGTCLVLLAGIAYLSRRIGRLPHIFGAVAQESLAIYFVHLCIVYGSVWNRGLAQTYGPTLTPAETVVVVILLILSMVGLAWYWNWWKHIRPRAARWTAIAVGAILLYRLL